MNTPDSQPQHFNLAQWQETARKLTDSALLAEYRRFANIPFASQTHVFRRELETRNLDPFIK